MTDPTAAWLCWQALFATDRLLGVRRSRVVASLVFRLGRRASSHSYWKTAAVSARPPLLSLPYQAITRW
jgi:hypothetical protein